MHFILHLDILYFVVSIEFLQFCKDTKLPETSSQRNDPLSSDLTKETIDSSEGQCY